ncbi:MAG TPA: YggS family pyridoxal phosphate-dependent enzyme [Gemmataceae bacterium]|nr:YggS family pyridoxal phosphate-dependent enzyme [Gemmataceae bacterium]
MTAAHIRSLLAYRLEVIEKRLAAACLRAGRARDDVTLVAVTKSVPVEVAAALPELGLHDLGESRPQELWRKAAALPDDVRWHLVGHLQRNKVERTLALVDLIHSVDSVRLLAALEGAAHGTVKQSPLPVLLEVNASREHNKHGFAPFVPEELPGLAAQVAAWRHIRVVGLMTMAAWEADPERCRPTFTALRVLRDQLRAELGPGHPLPHLSMGMTNDFEVAVEEGATLVRIGTALFEGLPGAAT